MNDGTISNAYAAQAAEETRVSRPEPIRVYLAGPLTKPAQSSNVHRAVMAADRLRRAGLQVFVPHLYTLWDAISPHDYEFWMQQDRTWLECCDVMVRLTGESDGSDREEKWAAELGMRVFREGEELEYGRPVTRRGISELVSAYAAGDVRPRCLRLPLTAAGPDPSGTTLRDPQATWATLEAFCAAVRAKLERNAHKVHWSTLTRAFLMGRLAQEHRELVDAQFAAIDGRQKVMDECVDVAAMAMMIWDNEVERSTS